MVGFDSSDVPNREELLQMAARAIQAGNKQGARVMLRKILAEDKRNERAMMWMAKIAANDDERRKWLDRILAVNPNNETARQTLDKINYKQAAERNRTLLRIGVAAWVVFVIIGAIVLFIILT